MAAARSATDSFTKVTDPEKLMNFLGRVAYKNPYIQTTECDYKMSEVSDVSFGRISRTLCIHGDYLYLLDRLLVKSKSSGAGSLQLTNRGLGLDNALLIRFATPQEILEMDRALQNNKAEYSIKRSDSIDGIFTDTLEEPFRGYEY
ncbi:MAG: hypothetical protein HZB76_07120 [Chlamydiae bacterium]|nr:hypothetical protein [Chlamydiota bacterium]